jgi:anti-sigma B factor antagonist
MKIEQKGDTLHITELSELGAANSSQFRSEVRAAMARGPARIEMDLSQMSYLDSSGLGALVAVHKTASSRNGVVRLLNPSPPIEQILELARMDELFDISKS